MKRATRSAGQRVDIAMRLLLVAAMALALLGGAVETSVAANRRTRTVTRTYVAPGARAFPLLVAVDTGICATSGTLGCVTFPTRPRDSYVRVRVTDSSHTGPVLVSVAQDLDGDGLVEVNEHYRSFCGNRGPVPLRRPGTDLAVFVYEAWARVFVTYGMIPIYPYLRNCDGAVATTGTVRATFSR